jgi:hypothetical protein
MSDTQLREAVKDVLQNFERVGGEDVRYLKAVAKLREFVPCESWELDLLERWLAEQS